MMGCLLVSHVDAYTTKTVNDKIALLGKHVHVSVVAPRKIRNAFGQVYTSLSDADTQHKVLRTCGNPDSVTKFFYLSWDLSLRQLVPDVILMDADPWALSLWQLILARRLYSPRSRFVVFTWENLRRKGIRGWVISRCYRSLAQYAGFFLAGNHGARDLLVAHAVDADKVKIIPQFGIDPEEF
jgi:hypothetical protein